MDGERIVREVADQVVKHVGGLDRVESSSLRNLWQRHHETIELLLAKETNTTLHTITRAFESDALEELAGEMPLTIDARAKLLFFAAASVAKELFRRVNATSRKRTIGGLPLSVAALIITTVPPQKDAPFILAGPNALTQNVRRSPPQHETVEPIKTVHRARGGPITRFAEAKTTEQTQAAWKFTGKVTFVLFVVIGLIAVDGYVLAQLFQRLGFYLGGFLALTLFALGTYGVWRLVKHLDLLDE